MSDTHSSTKWAGAKNEVLQSIKGQIPPCTTQTNSGHHRHSVVLDKLEQLRLLLKIYSVDPSDLLNIFGDVAAQTTTTATTNAAATTVVKDFSGFLMEGHPLHTNKSVVTLTLADIRSEANKDRFGQPDVEKARELLTNITDEQNFVNGMKDGIKEGLIYIFGDFVKQRTLDSRAHNLPIDRVEIHKLVKLITQRALVPTATECLQVKAQAMKFTIDWSVEFPTNHANLQDEQRKWKEQFGVFLSHTDVALIYRSQVEAAAKHDWGAPLKQAVRDIKLHFKHNQEYTAENLKELVECITTYDKERDYTEAPIGGLEDAFEVDDYESDDDDVSSFNTAAYSVVGKMMQEEESAYAVAKYAKPAATSTGKSTRSKGGNPDPPKTDEDDYLAAINRLIAQQEKQQDNPQNCPHCKRFGHKKGHPDSQTAETCFFNPANINDVDWTKKQNKWALHRINQVVKREKREARQH